MMSIADVLSRVAAIEDLTAQAVAPAAPPVQQSTFASALATASASYAPPASSGGSAVLAAAQSQVGVTEQPPGSNDGPQLAVYRQAVAGAQPGEPWCAYFASWAAAQAGEPLGSQGQGLGSVSEITQWASDNGRLLPASATPTPGDLILFGNEHVGIVESVNADGSLTTVEGNYANSVSRVRRSPGEATGYVAL
jgi:CHAP domain-containing protein